MVSLYSECYFLNVYTQYFKFKRRWLNKEIRQILNIEISYDCCTRNNFGKKITRLFEKLNKK